MTNRRPVTLQVDRRLLEHPRAYHCRRMRSALWLYLLVLTRVPQGSDAVELEPTLVAHDMGLPEGTIRSWLGHLRRLKYVRLERLNGGVRVSVTRLGLPIPPAAPAPRFFTRAKIERALSETGNGALIDETVTKFTDPAIRRALAGALAVPSERIRKSRTALFLYLLNHNDPSPTNNDPRP